MKTQTQKLLDAAQIFDSADFDQHGKQIDEVRIAAEEMALYIWERLVTLGAAGANANLSHPDRAEWERLARLCGRWNGQS